MNVGVSDYFTIALTAIFSGSHVQVGVKGWHATITCPRWLYIHHTVNNPLAPGGWSKHVPNVTNII